MQKRTLGRDGPQVSALGLGCMGMSVAYGPHDDAESLATLDAALDLGVNFLDTADMYGPHSNERLLAKLLARRRGEVVLATKFGIVMDPADPAKRGVNGRPEYVRACCEGSLKRLGVDHIDLYYQHRIDPVVPIEETVGAMADLVKAGKVRYLGLSEASPATLRRAAAVHAIHALQSEYSLWTRDPEDGALAACRELGVGFVAYSPLGRGFLTGAIKSPDDFAADDFRRGNPRFQGENFQRNLQLVDKVTELAAARGSSPAQLALAWLLAQGGDIVAIPGARKQANLRDNLGALAVELNAADLAALDAVFAGGQVSGLRYAADMMTMVNR
ncbi:aldo/keto reductase [Chromobacterium vaccinii]|uniref:aldo/keto reductase n=1 Tax=Chromobacterium vaccinii TaxID=1108595 RepID=UPI003C7671B8